MKITFITALLACSLVLAGQTPVSFSESIRSDLTEQERLDLVYEMG